MIAEQPADSRGIPAALRKYKRWAPWRREVRDGGKVAKVPVRAEDVRVRLSVSHPEKWYTFDYAWQAHQGAPDETAGVGFVMTGMTGLIGIDLDRCVDPLSGTVDEWAQEVIERVGGYIEFSPSGTGLRVFVLGDSDADWVNRERGIECYAGHAARFLTVTGDRHALSSDDVTPIKDGALEWLAQTYRKKAKEKLGPSQIPPMPEVLPQDQLPDIVDVATSLDYSESADMLLEGKSKEDDRSASLYKATIDMAKKGYSPQVMFSLLVHNEHTMEVAMDHRGQRENGALRYLWEQHVVKAIHEADTPQKRVSYVADLIEAANDELALESGAPKGGPETQAAGEAVEEAQAPPAGNDSARGQRGVFVPIQVAEYASQRGHIDWFVYGVLPRSDVSAVIGDSGSGKTFFVMDMAMAIASGTPWRGRKTKRGRVVYIAAEGAQGLKLRAQAWSRHTGVSLQAVDMHIIGEAPDMLDIRHVALLKRAVASIGPVDLIIVDTLAQVTPGADENSSKDMGEAMANCRKLGEALGATILLVGHTGKDSSRGFRGWSGIRAALDSLIEIARGETNRVARITKMKDGRGEGDEYYFNLTPIEMDYDAEWDETITSCIVTPIDGLAAERAKKLAAIRNEWERRVLLAAWDYLSGGKCKKPNFIAHCVGLPDVGEQHRDSVMRAVKNLLERGDLMEDEGLVWVG